MVTKKQDAPAPALQEPAQKFLYPSSAENPFVDESIPDKNGKYTYTSTDANGNQFSISQSSPKTEAEYEDYQKNKLGLSNREYNLQKQAYLKSEQQKQMETNKILNPEYANYLLQNPDMQTQEKINAINSQQQPGLDFGAALTEAGTKALAGAAGGVVAGAAGGALAGGLGAIPGAVIGGISGAIGGFGLGIYSALKDDLQKGVAGDYKSYTDSLTNIKSIIANAGNDPLDAISLYQIELAKIDRAERNLKFADEQKWTTVSKKQLIAIEDFNTYQRQQTYQLLLNAIANPKIKQNFEVPTEVNIDEAS